MRRFWGGLHTPRHTFLFNPKSFAELSNEANLSLQTIFFPINTDHWALSIQNYLQTNKLFKLQFKKWTSLVFQVFTNSFHTLKLHSENIW